MYTYTLHKILIICIKLQTLKCHRTSCGCRDQLLCKKSSITQTLLIDHSIPKLHNLKLNVLHDNLLYGTHSHTALKNCPIP